MQISDITSLKIEIVENTHLINEIKKIIEIENLSSQLNFNDQNENLQILNKYLNNQTTIHFKDLFSIKLRIETKGKEKVVDLKNQIESDGTNRIIRLVIIMSIINQLIINDKRNKIILFIDEIGTIDEKNRLEVLKFCKEYNFIPISAAPVNAYDGFNKYYYIRRGKGKLIVSENNGNVLIRKKTYE